MCFSKWQFRFADEVKAEGRGPDDTWRRFEQETRTPAPAGLDPRLECETEADAPPARA